MNRLTVALLALLGAAQAEGAVFTPLGDLAGGSFVSQATAVSDDGKVVVGYGSTASGDEAFRWTSSGGMTSLGYLAPYPGGGPSSHAYGVSADTGPWSLAIPPRRQVTRRFAGPAAAAWLAWLT